jgi:hypothetical protein
MIEIVRFAILPDTDLEVGTGEEEAGSPDVEIFPAPEAP